uniref:Uncharacterized protein n=1 Tax=Caenorhabditis japonica TaxID=281687 RepID=A0A8R1ISC6_CAEJA
MLEKMRRSPFIHWLAAVDAKFDSLDGIIFETTTTAPTTTTVSADFEPWNHGPSMKTRVQNVWNLLLFDRFFAEPDDDYWTLSMTSSTRDQSTEVTSTKTG